MELLYTPAIVLLGMYSKELRAESQRDICTSVFIAGRFARAATWKQHKYPSVDVWISNVIHTHTME